MQDEGGIAHKPEPPADAADRNPLHPASPETREDCIRKSLLRRLRKVCSDLSPEDFETLVLKMTREQLRSEGVRGKKNDPEPC